MNRVLRVGSGSLPFSGDKTLSRISKNHSSFDAHSAKVRAKFAEEVKLGRMLGPFRNDFLFPNSLFPTDQPWAAPLGAVEKDKWNHVGVRPVVDYSHNYPFDQNSLQSNPGLFHAYFTFAMLVDLVAWYGRNTIIVAADAVSAYRTLPCAPSALHRALRVIRDAEGVPDVYLDLCAPFGSVSSQQDWELLIAVVSFAIAPKLGNSLENYVDNFFSFVPPLPDGEQDEVGGAARVIALDEALAPTGIPLHERQNGVKVTGLGWWIHTDLLQIEMLQKRMLVAKELLLRWSGFPIDSLQLVEELEAVIGLFGFISVAFPAAKPEFTYLLRLGRSQKCPGRTGGRFRTKSETFSFTQEMKLIFKFWRWRFDAWDGRAPIRSSYPFCKTLIYLLKTDGATEMGAGAFLASPDRSQIRLWGAEFPEDVKLRALRKERKSSTFCELVAFWYALCLWAPLLAGLSVLVQLDSAVAVDNVRNGTAENVENLLVVSLIRLLCLDHNIHLVMSHVPREDNHIADLLSNLHFDRALALARSEFADPAVLSTQHDVPPILPRSLFQWHYQGKPRPFARLVPTAAR